MDRSNNFFRPSTSFADAVRGNPLTGPNAIHVHNRQQRKSVFDHLFFQDGATLETFWAKGEEYIGQAQRVDHQKFDLDPILNFGQPPLDQYLSEGRQSGIFSQCLSEGHPRWACKAPIRCFVC
jgi:hypothetical protein